MTTQVINKKPTVCPKCENGFLHDKMKLCMMEFGDDLYETHVIYSICDFCLQEYITPEQALENKRFFHDTDL